MNPEDFLYIGPVNFMGYSDTSAASQWIKLFFPDRSLLPALDAIDDIHGFGNHIFKACIGCNAFNSSDFKPLFDDLYVDIQMLDWCYKRRSGKGVEIRFGLDDFELLAPFRGASKRSKTRSGDEYYISLEFLDEGVEKTPKAKKTAKGAYGTAARTLFQSSFFRSPATWRVVGTDDSYNDWVKRQPSALSGDFSEHHDNGDVFSVPAHVRRSGESGTGYKPRYATIPLTNREHQLQHQKGESALFDGNADKATKWFERKRIEYVSKWCAEELKKNLGFDSWSEVPPSELYSFAKDKGLVNYLPISYKKG